MPARAQVVDPVIREAHVRNAEAAGLRVGQHRRLVDEHRAAHVADDALDRGHPRGDGSRVVRVLRVVVGSEDNLGILINDSGESPVVSRVNRPARAGEARCADGLAQNVVDEARGALRDARDGGEARQRRRAGVRRRRGEPKEPFELGEDSELVDARFAGRTVAIDPAERHLVDLREDARLLDRGRRGRAVRHAQVEPADALRALHELQRERVRAHVARREAVAAAEGRERALGAQAEALAEGAGRAAEAEAAVRVRHVERDALRREHDAPRSAGARVAERNSARVPLARCDGVAQLRRRVEQRLVRRGEARHGDEVAPVEGGGASMRGGAAPNGARVVAARRRLQPDRREGVACDGACARKVAAHAPHERVAGHAQRPALGCEAAGRRNAGHIHGGARCAGLNDAARGEEHVARARRDGCAREAAVAVAREQVRREAGLARRRAVGEREREGERREARAAGRAAADHQRHAQQVRGERDVGRRGGAQQQSGGGEARGCTATHRAPLRRLHLAVWAAAAERSHRQARRSALRNALRLALG